MILMASETIYVNYTTLVANSAEKNKLMTENGKAYKKSKIKINIGKKKVRGYSST